MKLAEYARPATIADLDRAASDAARRGLDIQDVGGLRKVTTFEVWVTRGWEHLQGDWPTRPRIVNGGPLVLPAQPAIVLPAEHNLAVDTGVHITARRTFNIGGPPAAVSAGGVDNSTSAVAAATSVFATTKYIRAFDATATYSTANKRITGDYTVTSTNISPWTVEIIRRFGISNSTSNAANSLYAMLSGFSLDFAGNTFSVTIRSRTDFSGA